MKFLVTGGAGFIGSHLVERLQKEKHQVIVLDNYSTGKEENLAFIDPSLVQIVRGDIRDLDVLMEVVKEMDGVFHQAALVSVPRSIDAPKLSFDINVNGTLNVFEAARQQGVKRVVFASSAAIYGNNTHLPLTERAAPNPLSPYGLDKLHTERMAALYQSLYGLETVALRYFNVYGPRQDPKSPYSGVISIFVDRLLQNRTPTIFGDGRQTRDFVFVGDIVQANMAAMFGPYSAFCAYNVGIGQSHDLNTLYDYLQSILGISQPPVYVDAREGDIMHSLSDITAIKRAFGYRPVWTLRAGLQALLDSILDASRMS